MSFGCTADCGSVPPWRMTNLSITFDFASASSEACGPAYDNVKDTHWNLCLQDDPSICAFEQTSSSPYGQALALPESSATVQYNITVFDAEWQLYMWVGRLENGRLIQTKVRERP